MSALRSCNRWSPAWDRLIAERRDDGRDPAGWRECSEHLDGCPDCRRRALTHDPTLLFRRLPKVEASAADIDTIRQGVAALRQAERLVGQDEPSFGGPAAGRRARRARWLQAAAAALLAVGLLSLGPLATPPSADGGATAEIDGLFAQLPDDWSSSEEWLTREWTGFERLEAAPVPDEPTIEELDLRDARVYQAADDGISVSMIVHSSLDV